MKCRSAGMIIALMETGMVFHHRNNKQVVCELVNGMNCSVTVCAPMSFLTLLHSCSSTESLKVAEISTMPQHKIGVVLSGSQHLADGL